MYRLLQFEAAISPPWLGTKPFDKEGRLRMPRSNRHQNYQIDPDHQTHLIHLQLE